MSRAELYEYLMCLAKACDRRAEENKFWKNRIAAKARAETYRRCAKLLFRLDCLYTDERVF